MTLEIASRSAPSEIIEALRADRQARLWAVDQLKLAPLGTSDDLLGECLHDDDKEVRMAAIHVIGERRNMKGLRCLYRVITTADLHWRGPEEQKAMVGAYTKVGGRGAVKVLAKILFECDLDEVARIAVVVGLTWIRTPEAIEALNRAVRHPAARVRSTAKQALAMIKRRELGARGRSLVAPVDVTKGKDHFAKMIAPARLPTACIEPLEEDTLQGDGRPPPPRLASSAIQPFQEDVEATVMCPSYRQPTALLSPS